jgi:mono/diheme cytochrome c family protein
MKDSNPRMRVQAIRASETLYKRGDQSLAEDYRTATKDADPDVALQALLTLNLLKVTDAAAVIKTTMEANKARGIQEIGKLLLAPPGAGRGGRGSFGLTPEQQDQLQRGDTIYKELCFSCHGPDGHGAPMAGAPPGTTMAPPLAGSPRVQGHRDYVTKVLLNGLTGPLGEKSFTEVMVPMGAQKDDWIAAIGSYVRNSFGNTGAFISPGDVARVRAATSARKAPWTPPELEASLPALVQPQPAWRVTASHNADKAPNALTLTGWSSGVPQQAGMWLQIEFPEPLSVAEIQFNAPGGRGGGPPAGAGAARGGGPPAAAGSQAPAGGPPAGGQPPAAGGTPSTAAPAGQPPTPAVQAPATGGRGAAPAPPRDYQIQVSMDGKKWGTPLAKGPISTITVAAFPPVRAKFVRITQTATAPDVGPWQIQNIRLFQSQK